MVTAVEIRQGGRGCGWVEAKRHLSAAAAALAQGGSTGEGPAAVGTGGGPAAANAVAAAAERPSIYGKIPEKLLSFIVQIDLSDGAAVTLDAYESKNYQNVFDPPAAAVSLVCRDADEAERRIAALARTVWSALVCRTERLDGRRTLRVEALLREMVLIGRSIMIHLRAEMLATEQTEAIYYELKEIAGEAQRLIGMSDTAAAGGDGRDQA